MNLSPRKYSKDVIYVLIIKQKKEKPARKVSRKGRSRLVKSLFLFEDDVSFSPNVHNP